MAQRRPYVMTRRGLIAGAMAIYGVSAFAQDVKEYHPTQEIAAWFARQKRPYHDDNWLPQITSCCDAGDAYPIEILEEATFGGKAEDGRARVTDSSARNIILPDGVTKYRPAITGALTFKYAGEKRVRDAEGNPFPTAWAFLRVMDGEIGYVYCVIPLPPSM